MFKTFSTPKAFHRKLVLHLGRPLKFRLSLNSNLESADAELIGLFSRPVNVSHRKSSTYTAETVFYKAVLNIIIFYDDIPGCPYLKSFG